MQSLGSETTTTSTFVAVGMPLPQEEQARADVYGLLGRLLLASPDDALLDGLAGADAIVSTDAEAPLDRAWHQLSLTARLLPFEVVREEYNTLFISTSVPRVNPYGSLYIAGFLHEKPLAALRADLARLGLGRRTGAAETEDHLGALCETMRLLIAGGPGIARQPVERQHAFFDAHIAPWYATALAHMREAEGAQFYARLAELAAAFFDIEREAFEVAEDDAAV
ncbi:MAG TPA: molecular chaperone TorD family protein [Telluria sp.]|nr:molecular chaperone TorD family protein [Telluria sp.]